MKFATVRNHLEDNTWEENEATQQVFYELPLTIHNPLC